MGAVTGTLSGNTVFAGEKKLVTITATLAATSDTITLTKADHGISSITDVISCNITSGTVATFTFARATADGLVLTVTSFEGDGTVATTFGNVSITVLGQL